MKKLSIIVICLLIITAVAYGQNNNGKSSGSALVNKLQYEDLNPNIPSIGNEVTRLILDNGLIIYLYENHSLPLINLNTIVKCGAIFDPLDKHGLSYLAGKVMRTGGTVSLNADSLNVILEFMAANLESSIGTEQGNVSLNVLTKDIETGIQLFADLIRHPAFPDDKLDLAREEIRNSIKRRNDSPKNILDRSFNNLIYGNHPYGRIQEWSSIKNITRDDLLAYHRRYFVPNNIMIGIAGDFNSQTMIDLLNKYLGDWKKTENAFPDYPAVAMTSHPGVFQINKDINQALVKLGHLGVKRDNPDCWAIDLMNYTLGGGSFMSRMTTKVRSDEGLAYTVRSNYEIFERDFGTFNTFTQTKSSTTYKAIDLLINEIRKIRESGVTEQELADAREAAINSFVFTFDNPSEIVNNLMQLEYDGFPADYYDKYIENYRRVTLDDIQRVAQQYLQPENLSIVVVGNSSMFEKPLDAFGEVKNLDLTDPVIE